MNAVEEKERYNWCGRAKRQIIMSLEVILCIFLCKLTEIGLTNMHSASLVSLLWMQSHSWCQHLDECSA